MECLGPFQGTTNLQHLHHLLQGPHLPHLLHLLLSSWKDHACLGLFREGLPTMATLPPHRDEIANKIADQIRSGDLPAHSKLPSTTELAEEYGVSVGTAYRVYRRLHELGLIYGRPGLGRFVAEIEH